VCVCVCERERESERARETGRDRTKGTLLPLPDSRQGPLPVATTGYEQQVTTKGVSGSGISCDGQGPGLRSPIGAVLNLRTATSQKCAAVPRRARI